MKPVRISIIELPAVFCFDKYYAISQHAIAQSYLFFFVFTLFLPSSSYLCCAQCSYLVFIVRCSWQDSISCLSLMQTCDKKFTSTAVGSRFCLQHLYSPYHHSHNAS